MPRRTPILIALALVLATCAAYWSVTGHQFVAFDDPSYVTENPQVRAGLSVASALWAFTTVHGANWHPLTWLSHQMDVSLFGLDPGGHHLSNLLLHLLNTVLVLLTLRRITGRLYPSVLVAGLFALHPLHVESVAWVSERKDLLCACFFLVTLLAYHQFVRTRLGSWYLLSLSLFAAALLSKPMAVTLPILLLLIDWWPLGRLTRSSLARMAREKLPFFLLTLASSWITFAAQKAGGAVASLQHITVGMRLANAAVSTLGYLEKCLWPTRLAALYPFPETISYGRVALALLILGLLAAGALWQRERRPYLAFGLGWFLIMLVPVIGVVQVGNQAMADRYSYLPLLGIFLALSFGGAELFRGRERLGAGISLTALALLAVMTRQQVAVWCDTETLYRHALRVTVDNRFMHHNLADELTRQGRWREASEEQAKVVRHWPALAEARLAYGNALFEEGLVEAAAAQYRAAVAINADYAEAYNNLGAALRRLGNLEGALQSYQAALRLNPADRKAQANLDRLRASLLERR
jgi:protein O-mannosyl-transferase